MKGRLVGLREGFSAFRDTIATSMKRTMVLSTDRKHYNGYHIMDSLDLGKEIRFVIKDRSH